MHPILLTCHELILIICVFTLYCLHNILIQFAAQVFLLCPNNKKEYPIMNLKNNLIYEAEQSTQVDLFL
jgi:hypothetical protein